MNLEDNENLANTAEGRSTVSVQEDFDDIQFVSRYGRGVARSVIIHDHVFEEGSATSSMLSSVESLVYHEHNVWNHMLEALCPFEVGVVLGALLDEVAMGRIALACHFSLDVSCDKSSSLPVVTDNVTVRNWSPPLPLYVVTECAHVGTLTIENEPAFMQYVMDGSTWSFICPFLHFLDTFNMRTAATTWNSAAKYPCGELLFFLLHNAPGHSVDEHVQVDSSIWWLP